MIVVDTSVVVEALVDGGPSGQRARQHLRRHLIAPSHLQLEVISAIRRHLSAHLLTSEAAAAAVAGLLDASIELKSIEQHIPRIWQLRHSISIYDAAYVALAEATNSVLLTGDKRLAQAAAGICDVELVD